MYLSRQIVICLHTEHLGVHKNSLKRFRAFQIDLEKPLGARTDNKLNPHMAPTPGFEPRPHWWEASALTTNSRLQSCSPLRMTKDEKSSQSRAPGDQNSVSWTGAKYQRSSTTFPHSALKKQQLICLNSLYWK